MKKTICEVCPRRCELGEGQRGACGARGNKGGAVVSLNYGRLTSLALDPVEKKPLARWESGKYILSAGSFGCNLFCPFCQNYQISRADERTQTENCPPKRLTELAQGLKSRGNVGIAFTYNEPLIGFEYVRDCAVLAKEAGLKIVLVTNGCMNAALFAELLPLVDALNIDLKSFAADFYRNIGGDLDTVKENIAAAAKMCHVEVTTLVIPGQNDSAELMEQEAAWLFDIDPRIPLHLSRFFPRYKMANATPTPIETIKKLQKIAVAHLQYVYLGNC